MIDAHSARRDELHAFVAAQFSQQDFTLAPASADASFRSYWRVDAGGATRIVMDAPPDKENLAPWLDIGARLRDAGLHAPEVFGVDLDRGFVLMEDLGDRAYLPALNTTSADSLYADALDALLTMQTQVSPQGLPAFDDAFLTMELELMPTWFLDRHLGHTPGCEEWDVIEPAFRLLIETARAQPQVFMHRDFHSRNLMLYGDPHAACENPTAHAAHGLRANPGIIDFQGAVLGPIAYDLASLLRDCYIAWPIERVDAWVERYRQRLLASGVVHASGAQFRRWFDLTGLQRHIKVLGIFCRLHYRDGKPQYLADLPLVLDYVLSVCRLYPELEAFAELIARAIGERDIRRERAREPRA
ncbi:MAG: phosphotransferase [Proteobacteria bacterium]|nr:phosphotransferase [Pseudomonadota bacterium]